MARKARPPHSPVTLPEAACHSLRIELAAINVQLFRATDINTIKSLMKEMAVVEAALQRCPPMELPHPDVSGWLAAHPNIAAAIKWQTSVPDPVNAYAPPTDANKIAWQNWSASQKADLVQAYQDACVWFDAGAAQVPMNPNGLTDEPQNIHPSAGSAGITVMEWVTPAYMWKLYVAHVGFSLAAEITNRLPWSISGYSDLELRYLFDSATMGWLNLMGTAYSMGTYTVNLPAFRADNRPKTGFGPPMWTYPFLINTGIIAATRLATIGKLLDWMRQNLWHFFGQDTFDNCAAVWQYRGYPPLSKITNGTVDMNNPSYGVRHWTMGCHGSVGFIHALLRVLNIPVQPVWTCGHELACFLTEAKYLDHGDDPYNLNVTASTQPSLSLLIDEATYQARFSNDLTINPTAMGACNYVGYQAANFPP
jgi:hypothetical protein